jgi:hypothetical protein
MLYRRCKLSMGKGDFRGSADWKPLDRSTPNFEPITTVLTSCYKPTFITIAPRGSSAQYGEVAHFSVPQFFFFSLLVTTLLRNAPVDLPSLCLKRRGLRQGSAFWGLIDEKFFQGEYPFPEFSEGILHANRKSRITFDRWEIDAKFQSRSIPNRGQGIDWWRHFRSSTPPSGRNRLSAIFGNKKSANNVETLQDRR